jgi:hypothetical protein
VEHALPVEATRDMGGQARIARPVQRARGTEAAISEIAQAGGKTEAQEIKERAKIISVAPAVSVVCSRMGNSVSLLQISSST